MKNKETISMLTQILLSLFFAKIIKGEKMKLFESVILDSNP